MSAFISFQHSKYLGPKQKHPLSGVLMYSCSKEEIYMGIVNIGKSSLFEDL